MISAAKLVVPKAQTVRRENQPADPHRMVGLFLFSRCWITVLIISSLLQAICQAPTCQNRSFDIFACYEGRPYPCSVGENLCSMCLQAPKMAHSHFCSQTCVDDAESKGPMILEVPAGHSTFKSGKSPDLDSSSCFLTCDHSGNACR
jgi:hypothetical protein